MLNKDLDRTPQSRPETASDKPTEGHLHPRADAHSHSRKFGPDWAWVTFILCSGLLALCSRLNPGSVLRYYFGLCIQGLTVLRNHP